MQLSANAADKPPNACQQPTADLTAMPRPMPQRVPLPSSKGPSVLDTPHPSGQDGLVGGAPPVPSLNPLPSSLAERELREESQERGPVCCAANSSQHTLRCSAQGTRLPRAWQAASLKEVINSQAPAQDKHLRQRGC